jgi:HK97 family phage major capsid protein
MTIEQLIERVRAERAGRLAARNAASDQLRELRGADTPDDARIAEVRASIDALDGEIDTLSERVRGYEAELERDQAALRLSAETAPAAARASYDSVIRTGDTNEPRTYTERGNVNEGVSFFSDAYRHSLRGDARATERIMRHAREVEVHNEMTERATNTGTFAGLVVPQYLINLAAPALANGRPLANNIQRLQIPEQGMSFTIPRGTTPASADVQATENSNVSSTDEAWSNLTVNVVTIAGQQDVSRQSLERGSGVDSLIYLDLVKRYAARLDLQIINGSGASGQALGILNTAGIGAATAFGAAPSATNFNLKVAGANTNVYSAGDSLAPEFLVMHPRRWGWLTGLVDSTGRPIVQANTAVAQNPLAVGAQGGSEDFGSSTSPFVGVHSSGLPVLLDRNIPTTVGTNSEDIVLSVDGDELLLWEDGDGMPRELSFEQTTGGSLTTKLLVYGYVAFTAGRYPQAVSKIGGLDATAGQGLIAPTF